MRGTKEGEGVHVEDGCELSFLLRMRFERKADIWAIVSEIQERAP